MTDFKVYYGDETVWEGDEIENAPRLNVQAIAWADPTKDAYGVGRCVLQAADYYVYVYDQNRFIQILNETDLIDHVLHSGQVVVFKGRTIRDDIFRRIALRASTEIGMPLKSAINSRLEGTR